MGMTLKIDDFAAIARRPKPVFAGVAAQYTVMVRENETLHVPAPFQVDRVS